MSTEKRLSPTLNGNNSNGTNSESPKKDPDALTTLDIKEGLTEHRECHEPHVPVLGVMDDICNTLQDLSGDP